MTGEEKEKTLIIIQDDFQKSLTHERPKPNGSAPAERPTSQDNKQENKE